MAGVTLSSRRTSDRIAARVCVFGLLPVGELGSLMVLMRSTRRGRPSAVAKNQRVPAPASAALGSLLGTKITLHSSFTHLRLPSCTAGAESFSTSSSSISQTTTGRAACVPKKVESSSASLIERSTTAFSFSRTERTTTPSKPISNLPGAGSAAFLASSLSAPSLALPSVSPALSSSFSLAADLETDSPLAWRRQPPASALACVMVAL